ncbi:MAG TPA: 50S ribosomal protein L9 [Coriobacteriia bacterium]|jgi:large subunit ribosomal protein L9
MKVILLDEAKGKGREGEVVDVARGFAVNYLLPRKLAVEATAGNLKQLDARKGNIDKREAARRSEAEQLAEAIAGKKVVVEAKAGDEGRLYGSVTSVMIAEAIAAQLGVDVDRRRMDVHGHIKTLGEHPVTVAVHQDVKADLIVKVVAVGGAPEAEAVAAPEPVPSEEPAIEPAEGEETAEETPEEDESAE